MPEIATATGGSALADLAARTVAAARRRWPDATLDGLARMTGGHSGTTVTGTLTTGGTSRAIVVKAATGGSQRSHDDMLRQESIYVALAGIPGIPVPEVLFADHADPALLAIELIGGDALEPVLDPLAGASLGAGTVRARALRSAEVLAALHAVDPRQLAVDHVASAPQLPATTPTVAELARWVTTMNAVPAALCPGADQLVTELERAVPREAMPSIVHGDYRLGNLLCDGPDVRAIIDWEIWFVGDPRLDLGWYLAHFDPASYPGIGAPVPGLPSPADVLAHYIAAGGADPAADWPWFDAFGRFKLAAIMGHNLRRHREGRRSDPFQERLVPVIPHLIATAVERLRT